MKLYIFRHAIARLPGQHYDSEVLLAPILPQGVYPTKKIGKYLKEKRVDFYVTSEVLRCRQTAEIVSNVIGKKFSLDKNLNEFHPYNLWMNESFTHFKKRITTFLQEMEKSKYKSIVICSHASVIVAIIRYLKEEDFSESDIVTNYPIPGVLLIVENGKVKEIDFNTQNPDVSS